MLNAAFLPMAMAAGLTSAIMNTAPVCVESVRAADLLLGHDPWGASWIAAHRGRQSGRGGRGAVTAGPAVDGAQRVRLRFEPDGADVRVPTGTPIFDAASWNGIAIDSTCGGHGTCKKCKVRIDEGDVPISAVDPRAFSPDELRDGWRLACRAPARADLVVHVPPLQTRPKAALVGVGRHVILRPAVQKRHLVLEEPTLEDQRSDVARVLDALDDLEPRVELAVVRTLGKMLREAFFDVTAVVVRRRADRGRAGRHHRAALRDRVRPRHDDRRRDAARPRDRHARGGAVDAQPPAAVRRRRDLARVGHDARRRGARRARGARARDARRSSRAR